MLLRLISASPGKPLQLVIARNGYSEAVVVTPESAMEGDKKIGRIGISVQPVEIPEDRIVNVNYGLLESLIPWYRDDLDDVCADTAYAGQDGDPGSVQ